MINSVLKKTIFLSLLGHFAVFSIFNLSFGNKLPKTNYSTVSFWGQFLHNAQLTPFIPKEASFSVKRIFFNKPETKALDKEDQQVTFSAPFYLKPAYSGVLNLEKKPFMQQAAGIYSIKERREPAIIFHPILPYWFPLYFRDRQTAHVELSFNFVSTGEKHAIVVRRKISSGNLEVDLLTMRYIEHYLFIEQARFLPNNWQTIKIDLSAKND